MKDLFKQKPQKVIFWAGFFVVLLLTFVGLGINIFYKGSAKTDPNVLAVVAGEKLTKKDFNEFLYGLDFQGTPENPDKAQEIEGDKDKKKGLFDDFVKARVILREGQDSGVTISEEELDKKYEGSNYSSFSEAQKKISRMHLRASLLEEKMTNETLDWRSGNFIFFRFDKYFTYEDSVPKVEGAGNEKLINEQKEYAKKKADEVSAKLENKELTFEEAGELVNGDTVIGYNAFAPITPQIKGETTKEEYLLNENKFDIRSFQGFKENIKGLKKGEISQPFAIKSYVNGEMLENAYVIFDVKDGTVGTMDSKVDWYDSLLKKHKVEIYYSNLGIEVANEKHSFRKFLESFTPVANAACPPAFSTVSRVQYKAWIQIVQADGVNSYRERGAQMRLYAGNQCTPDNSNCPSGSTARTEGGETDLWVYTTTCGSYSSHHYYDKKAEDDGTNSGYMYSSHLYTSENVEYRSVLANCSSTSTGSITFYEPVSTAWAAGSGSWAIYSQTSGINNGTAASTADNFWYKINMGGLNGETLTIAMKYTPHYNTKPSVTHISPAHNGSSLQIADGQTTYPVTFHLRGDDVDNDTIGLRVAYQRRNDDGTWPAGWSYSDYIYGTADHSTTRYDWSYKLNDGYTRYTEVKNLAAGHYKWRVLAQDVHGLVSEADVPGVPGYDWGGYGDSLGLMDWEFDVVNPLPQSLSCAVVPQTGSVPFKVTVNVTPTNIPGTNADTLYTFNMGDSISTSIQRKSGFNYTYNTAGDYTITANYNSLSATCSPQATATNPRGGSGGEVAP